MHWKKYHFNFLMITEIIVIVLFMLLVANNNFIWNYSDAKMIYEEFRSVLAKEPKALPAFLKWNDFDFITLDLIFNEDKTPILKNLFDYDKRKLLLEYGFSPNRGNILISFAFDRKKETLLYLKHGALPGRFNITDGMREEVLSVAYVSILRDKEWEKEVIRNTLEIVPLLLDAGADINFAYISEEGEIVTPLYLSVVRAFPELTNLLLKKGASIKMKKGEKDPYRMGIIAISYYEDMIKYRKEKVVPSQLNADRQYQLLSDSLSRYRECLRLLEQYGWLSNYED